MQKHRDFTVRRTFRTGLDERLEPVNPAVSGMKTSAVSTVQNGDCVENISAGTQDDDLPPEGYTVEEWRGMRSCAEALDWSDPDEPVEPTPVDGPRWEPPGHQLYRHYDAAGVLLYVGISQSTMHRLAGHKGSSHWFWRIATVKIEHYPTRQEAAAAETAAIAAELPLYNIERNGKGSRHYGRD